MSNKVVDIGAEQGKLKELLSLVAAGAEILLTEGGTPVARLVPVSPRIAGLHSGSVTTSADFDAPLPDGFWTAPV
jgi:prevent-host-death family protein